MAKIAVGLGIAAAFFAAPSSAAVFTFAWSGSVSAIQGEASGADIDTGAPISARFRFDDMTAGAAAVLPFGGGTYSIYNIQLTDFSLSIGSYVVNQPRLQGSLTYMDNTFGGDGLVFLAYLPGGPFGSTSTSVQFQGRGPVSSIDGTGLANGVPFERFQSALFANFATGNGAKRVFGDLTLNAVSPVPEPDSWMLMISGFLLIGCAMRTRNGRDGYTARIFRT